MAEVPVSVTVLAYGDEPLLHDAVAAVLASTGVSVDLVVVDNGCTSDAVATLPPDPRLRVISPGRNTGFAGGVHLGFAIARHDVLVMVNSDAVVAPDCLALLARRLDDDPTVALAGAVLMLADDPDRVNSAGNVLHVLGLGWAGHLGETLDEVDPDEEPTYLSGGCLAVRRRAWEQLGGFNVAYLAYHEDADLCWRARQAGWRVALVRDARAVHHYEFSRSPLKLYLLERNRLLFVLTCYEAPTLLLLAAPLLALEAAMLPVAASQGWTGQKVQGWLWLLRHAGDIRRRRRVVAATRTVRDAELAGLLTDTFDPNHMPLPRAALPLEALLKGWWKVACHLLPRSPLGVSRSTGRSRREV